MIPTATDWQKLFVDLAVHVTVAVAATALVSCWLSRPAWRRSFWQTCTLALVGMFLFDLVGLNHELAAPLQRLIVGADKSNISSNPANRYGRTPIPQGCNDRNSDSVNESADLASLPGGSTFDIESRTTSSFAVPKNPTQLLAAEQVVFAESESIHLQPTEVKPAPGWLTIWWPGILWLLGAGLVAARAAGARLLLVAFRFRHTVIQDAEFFTRFRGLARQLGIRRTILVIEVPALISPFTFGTIRPTVALPATFVPDLDPAKQHVMLAHELAHVAGHDPAWLLATDLMTALLWWHPLAWWCRNQLRSACEDAADQASLLIADGPAVLAACLIELGGRLVNHSQVGSASVAGNGFRSSLGRRVERLLHLNGQTWSRPPRRRLLVLLIATVPILLMVVTLSAACLPWSGDRDTISGLSKGDKSMTYWRQSIASMAVCVFLAPATDTVVAQDTSKPVSSSSSSERKNETPIDDPAVAISVSEPGQLEKTAPAPQRIKIFRLIHRQPGEVLEILRGLTPEFEGGAQGVPVPYTAFVTEGPNGRPGMNTGSSIGGPGGGMANMMARMGGAPTAGGTASMMAAMMSGPTSSSATPASRPNCLFAIDPRTRSLIVRGPEKDLQVVSEFVAILDLPDDKPIPKLKNVHAFKLRFAKPSDVNEVLKALNVDVLVAPIPKSNILLLNGPDSAIKEATEIIEALDAEVKEGTIKGAEEKAGVRGD